MKQNVVRLLITLALLAWLAACGTAPPSPAAPASSPLPIPTAAQPATPAANPRAAGMPDAEPPSSSDPAPSALLAGEVPKEWQRGQASWYGPRFHGRLTASGERYDMHALTAAHRSLPFGTWVRVHSLVNGREVDVRINDRGPFTRGRVIDLSHAAAEALDMKGLGVKDVVLLVPESTPAAVEAPPPPTKKRPPEVRRTARPR